MKWLFWREYRLNRPILIFGAVLLLLPYAFALIVLRWASKVGEDIPELLLNAGIFSLALSQLTVALLGGNAIAGERADRSAEFMAYLPVPRGSRLIGKLSLAAVTALVTWGVNLLVAAVLLSLAPDLRRLPDLSDINLIWAFVAVTGLTFYCVGWLISSFQSSATFAVGGGLVTPLVVFMLWAAVAWLSELRPETFDQFIGTGYPVSCILIAAVCFPTGAWYFLRRVEP